MFSKVLFKLIFLSVSGKEFLIAPALEEIDAMKGV